MLTDLNFLAPGQPWPPESELERLKTYQANRNLFEGKHELVFRDWIRLLREDKRATLELILNWHKRLSTLWGNLLLGEPPRISAGDKGSPEQSEADNLINNNRLIKRAFEVALDVSRFGDGLFKIRHDSSRAIIEGQTPTVWFPVVSRDNVKDITAHVLAWAYDEVSPLLIGAGNRKQQFLKAEIHERGKITTRVYKLINQGQKIGELAEEEKVQDTGVDDFLVIQISNLITTDRGTGIDDYSDLDGIIQELEIRVAQISRILDKHSDPNMYGPDSALEVDPLTGQATFRAGGKYFPLTPGDDPPGYVTWDGQLEASFKEIDVLMEQLYILSETSPAAFGQLKSGLAESGSALRRLMMAPLAKVNRIRMEFDPALKKALQLAAALDVAQGTRGAVKLDSIHIDWFDGLPQDDTEQTQIEVQRKSAGLTSLESSLRRLDGLEGESLQKEIDRINNDQKIQSSRPTISLPGRSQGGEE